MHRKYAKYLELRARYDENMILINDGRRIRHEKKSQLSPVLV